MTGLECDSVIQVCYQSFPNTDVNIKVPFSTSLKFWSVLLVKCCQLVSTFRLALSTVNSVNKISQKSATISIWPHPPSLRESHMPNWFGAIFAFLHNRSWAREGEIKSQQGHNSSASRELSRFINQFPRACPTGINTPWTFWERVVLGSETKWSVAAEQIEFTWLLLGWGESESLSLVLLSNLGCEWRNGARGKCVNGLSVVSRWISLLSWTWHCFEVF